MGRWRDQVTKVERTNLSRLICSSRRGRVSRAWVRFCCSGLSKSLDLYGTRTVRLTDGFLHWWVSGVLAFTCVEMKSVEMGIVDPGAPFGA